MTFTKTYIKVNKNKAVNEGRQRNMDVDMCDNWWGIKAFTIKSSVVCGMDSVRSDVLVRLVESEIPSRAGTNDAYGELDESPLIDRGRASPVWMNSLRKLCATVSLASSGW